MLIGRIVLTLNAIRARLAERHAEDNLRNHRELWELLQAYRHSSNSTGCSYYDYWKLYSLIRQRQPSQVLECGTGLSTLILAMAVRDNQRDYGRPGYITSMEDQLQWFQHATELFPLKMRQHVDFVHSPQVEYHESIFRGVGYKDIPDRSYDVVFVDGPNDVISPAQTPVVNLDYIQVLRRTSHPLFGVIDGRLGTCFVYQSLLGIDKVHNEDDMGLTTVGPCTCSDLQPGRPIIGFAKRDGKRRYYVA